MQVGKSGARNPETIDKCRNDCNVYNDMMNGEQRVTRDYCLVSSGVLLREITDKLSPHPGQTVTSCLYIRAPFFAVVPHHQLEPVHGPRNYADERITADMLV